jgi:hypothetical protein
MFSGPVGFCLGDEGEFAERKFCCVEVTEEILFSVERLRPLVVEHVL